MIGEFGVKTVDQPEGPPRNYSLTLQEVLDYREYRSRVNDVRLLYQGPGLTGRLIPPRAGWHIVCHIPFIDRDT